MEKEKINKALEVLQNIDKHIVYDLNTRHLMFSSEYVQARHTLCEFFREYNENKYHME